MLLRRTKVELGVDVPNNKINMDRNSESGRHETLVPSGDVRCVKIGVSLVARGASSCPCRLRRT